MRSFGINESGVAESLRAGVDIVTYSGDKMLGGPQAGMLSGREDLIKKVRSNPLFRALRVDKLTYAVLEATLMEYVRQNHDAIPFLRMMHMSAGQIKTRAEALQSQLAGAKHLRWKWSKVNHWWEEARRQHPSCQRFCWPLPQTN